MTAPEMESVIAAALAGHWSFSTDTDDYPRFVDRCDGCHEIVFNHGRENNQNQSYAAHQARAVLAAISEDGTVEWGVRTSSGPALAENEREARISASIRKWELLTRSIGPWMSAE